MAGEGGLGDNAREGELMTGREGREKEGKEVSLLNVYGI